MGLKIFFLDTSIALKKKWNFRYNDNTNILGVISFCIAFGMIIGSMGRKAEILLHLLLVLNEITMKLVTMIMWYAPFGILFLVAGKILEIDDMGNTARKLGLYMITVIVGLMIHCFVTLCTLYFAITRKNPFKFYYGCLQVQF
jgi:Na+/H+-dicarboxylate symporter